MIEQRKTDQKGWGCAECKHADKRAVEAGQQACRLWCMPGWVNGKCLSKNSDHPENCVGSFKDWI